MENVFMDDSKPAPGLRCPHCSGPLFKEAETISRTAIKETVSMIGIAVGGTLSGFYGVNRAMPLVQRYVRGPVWFQFLVGIPPLMLFSSSSAVLGGAAASAIADFFISKPTSWSESAATLDTATSLSKGITEPKTSAL